LFVDDCDGKKHSQGEYAWEERVEKEREKERERERERERSEDESWSGS
jgi:hypothetical protein